MTTARASHHTPETGRNLLLAVGGGRFSLEADRVIEVIRRPAISRVPNGPDVLVGISNLRGVPLPVVDLHGLLGNRPRPGFPGERIIVYDCSGGVGLLVDDVFNLSDAIGATAIRNLEDLLTSVFVSSVGHQGSTRRVGQAAVERVTGDSQELRSFLAFAVGTQTYGIALDAVEQVIAIPKELARSAGPVMMTFRDRILPVAPLASVVGLPDLHGHQETSKIVVIRFDRSAVGLRVDGISTILRLAAGSIDAVPAILKRSAGTAELEGIGRYNGGRSLVAILSPEKLFGNTILEMALADSDGGAGMSVSQEVESLSHEKSCCLPLGDETYGIPLGAVDEVIRLPDSITRVPNAPDFILGIVNLRGGPLPLLDQRSRFGTTASSDRPRAIVVTVDDLQAGFVVDSVTEIVSVSLSDITPSPDFSSETTAVFDRVAHVEKDGRMILIIDPRELLTRSERDLVSALAEARPAAKAP